MSARSRSLLCAALALSLSFAAARAGELVVVEARGIALPLGTTIDDTQPLSLKQGQHVTLIAADGSTMKLDGPYDKAPAVTEKGGDDAGAAAIRALLTQANTRTEPGIVRGGTTQVVLPTPWVLDVSRNGVVCLIEGDKPVLWREDASAEAPLSILPGDRTWRAEATWTQGKSFLRVPGDLPIAGGKTYNIRLGKQESVITVKTVPNTLPNDAARTAWLRDVGCDAQAAALLKTLKLTNSN